MDQPPSYDQAAADSAAPEYEEPDPNEQSATTRIAIRRGTQNRLANERYGDIKALLDIKVNQTSGSAKQLLVSWRDKLLRLLRQPDKDDSFNFYTTSNYAKIDRQIRILVGRNLASFFHVAFLNSSTNANAKPKTEISRLSRTPKVKDKYKASTVVKELHLVAPELIRFDQLHYLIRRIAAQAKNRQLQGVTEAALTQVLNQLCVNDWNFRHRENWLTIWDEFQAIYNGRELILDEENNQVLEEYKPQTFIRRLHLEVTTSSLPDHPPVLY
ncbi:hypothetical protein JCM5353_002095 [Sporobolomyces roseus]